MSERFFISNYTFSIVWVYPSEFELEGEERFTDMIVHNQIRSWDKDVQSDADKDPC